MTNEMNEVKEFVEEVVEDVKEEVAPPTRRQRVKNWIKAHKVQVGIGAGAAVLTGAALAVKKLVADKTGIDLGETVADVAEEIAPPEV